MLEKLHDHIVDELGQSSRSDTIFIVVSIVFNLIVLAVNSAVSGQAASYRQQYGNPYNLANDIVLYILIIMTILINISAIAGLFIGRQSRNKMLNGLLEMYEDNNIAKYFDKSLISNYGTRYLLFGGIITLLAITAIIVPLIVRYI
jgi:hypothetical protein